MNKRLVYPREYPEKFGRLLREYTQLLGTSFDDVCARFLYGDLNFVAVEYKKGKNRSQSQIVPGNVYDHKIYNSVLNLSNDIHSLKNIQISNIIRGPIPRSGKDEIRLMVLGKGPGVEEENYGCNFVGSIGLDALQLVSDYGLFNIAGSVYLTNVVKWRPVINSEAYFKKFAKDCIPILYNEIAIFEPDIIVYFGSKSVYQVVADFLDIKDDLNALQYFELDRGDKVITGVIIGSSFRFTSEDRAAFVLLINSLVGEEIPAVDEIKFTVIETVEQVKEVVNRWLEANVDKVACDLEWYGKFGDDSSYLRCMQLAARIDGKIQVYIIALSDELGNYNTDDVFAKVAACKPLLLHDDITIVGSFFYTDTVWLQHYGLDLLPKYMQCYETRGRKGILDVAMAEAVCDEYARLDLCKIAKKYLGVEAWDVDLENWKKDNDRTIYCGHAPSSILFPYAAADVYYSLEISDRIQSILEKDPVTGKNLYGPYVNNICMCAALSEMMYYGICIDKGLFNEIGNKFQQAYDSLLEEVRQEINWPEFDPNKNRHLIAVLFGNEYLEKPVLPETAKCIGLKPVKSTNKRYSNWNDIPDEIKDILNVSVDAESLGILAGENAFASKLRDLGFLRQALKTVFGKQGLLSHVCSDGAIRSFIAPTTETGRCRSSKPNLQNFSNRRNSDYARICKIDKFPKDCLIARKGYKLVEMDFAAAELFLLGVMSGSDKLVDHCIRSSLPESDPNHYDIHSRIAVKAFRLSCPPTKKGLEQAGKKHLRVSAKSVVYGLNYGRGEAAIVRQVEAETGIVLGIEDVVAIKKAFFDEYEEVPYLLEQLKDVVYDPGYQINYFGRTRRFKRLNDKEFMSKQERESLNFAFQSTVADYLDIFSYLVLTSKFKEDLGYRLLVPIHDALLFEVPEEVCDVFCEEFLPIIVNTIKFGRWTPLGEHVGPACYVLGFDYKVR